MDSTKNKEIRIVFKNLFMHFILLVRQKDITYLKKMQNQQQSIIIEFSIYEIIVVRKSMERDRG